MASAMGGAPMGQASLHEALLRYAREIVAVVDGDGVVRYVNDATRELLGFAPAEVDGRKAVGYLHPDDAQAALEHRQWLMVEPGRSGTTVLRVRSRDGWRHVETTGVNLLHDPAVRGVLYVTRDVEQRMRDATALACAIAAQRVIAELGLQALTTTDLDVLMDVAVEQVADLLGAPTAALKAVAPGGLETWDLQVVNPDGTAGGEPALEVGLRGPHGHVGVLTVEGRDEPYTEFDRDVLCAIANVLTGALLRADRERRAVTAALHDPLTGLATRPLLDERLERALAREAASCALVMVDLDGFKDVNDSHGHAVGDEVLRLLGPRLLACVRPTDTVARFGGDEFVILCEETEQRDLVEQIAVRVRQACAAPFDVTGGQRVQLSGSVGIAWSTEQPRTPGALLTAADEAMYLAKRGR